jgi:hypothetical protein
MDHGHTARGRPTQMSSRAVHEVGASEGLSRTQSLFAPVGVKPDPGRLSLGTVRRPNGIAIHSNSPLTSGGSSGIVGRPEAALLAGEPEVAEAEHQSWQRRREAPGAHGPRVIDGEVGGWRRPGA